LGSFIDGFIPPVFDQHQEHQQDQHQEQAAANPKIGDPRPFMWEESAGSEGVWTIFTSADPGG
jgi:hypothetical protein